MYIFWHGMAWLVSWREQYQNKQVGIMVEYKGTVVCCCCCYCYCWCDVVFLVFSAWTTFGTAQSSSVWITQKLRNLCLPACLSACLLACIFITIIRFLPRFSLISAISCTSELRTRFRWYTLRYDTRYDTNIMTCTLICSHHCRNPGNIFPITWYNNVSVDR